MRKLTQEIKWNKLIGTRVPVWQVLRSDPGYLYFIKNNDKYKLGKSKNPTNRVRAAKTWLPDMKIVGCKPFWQISIVERSLHAGFSRSWYVGEWFKFECGEERDWIIQNFRAFSNEDIDMNSVNFIYWMNGEGMSEFVMEMGRQKLTLRKFLKQETLIKK
jgi:hypothetical protein